VRIGILEADGFSTNARARLAGLGEVAAFAGDDLSAFLADKDALFVRLGYRIDDVFLRSTPRLRVICSPTTGMTHIDLESMARHNVTLLSLKGETAFLEGIRATPEHAIGLLLALLRRYRTAFLASGNAHWDRDLCRGEELSGMPIGIIGLGRVGRRLASYLRAFEASIGWYDPFVREAAAGTTRYHSLAELIAQSRVIVLAATHENGQPPIVDADAVAALTGKYFVNIARGELVDEEALLMAIENGSLAGCAIDVIANEHLALHRARWIAATAASNVIVTPHIAGATFTSMQKTEEFLVNKLIAFLRQLTATRGRLHVQ
jgi:D-3-phosphoglycerate dehydrogenase